MHSMKRFVALLLVLALALAGCGGRGAQPTGSESESETETEVAAGTPAETLTTVKVGNVTSLLFAPLYVALEKGYFEEQGIEVQLEPVQAGQDAMVFLANGQLDFVLAGYSAAIFNAVGRGLDLKVIAPMGIQPAEGDPSPLVVRTELVDSGEVTTAADLKGRKIAVLGGAGATGSFLTALRLQKAGLTLEDVELVNVGLADQEAALSTGAVDAALMSEPYSSKAISSGVGKAVDVGALAGVNASGLITSGTMLREKPAVVTGFVAALLKAARDIQGEQFKTDEHLQMFEKYTKLSTDVLAGVQPYHFDPNFDMTAPKRELAALQEIMLAAGILKLDQPLEIDQVVDETPATEAADRLGRVE